MRAVLVSGRSVLSQACPTADHEPCPTEDGGGATCGTPLSPSSNHTYMNVHHDEPRVLRDMSPNQRHEPAGYLAVQRRQGVKAGAALDTIQG